MESEQVDNEIVEEENSGNSKNVSAEDSSSCKSVKSTAVVKYSAVQSPANFALLQCNTNLNLPPSNWLSSSAECYGLQYVPSHSSGFSSFRMAHMFPDCVGEVDVVSDAENIKKLLKIPYSKGPVSMMVHCIENTLLIDEFDIHKHLLRTAETEWEWLKKFFFDHILKSLSEKEKALFHKNKSRCALQQKSLASKFLYHSLVVADPNKSEQNACEDKNIPHVDTSLPVATAWPPLPEPRIEENFPDPTSNHKFARNVVWTFEDIQMLIGTDMPIFGGTTHPCISLRLRDMSKPINVLTGIDYWLDNLMCNVPEVVMCYHLDGIVQKYELIKTEDLPHLEDSKFSPKLIRDVAQNILSFLKSNATKAGHTYWLFKGKDDDVVKLYDLTSLCTDVLDEKGQNPFTVPVAMLLYRVARNMRQSSDSRRQQGTIRTLLKNCVALLPKEKYPQIVTSAHYMLSDLYIPADIDPASPGLDSEDDETECSTENHSEHEDSESLLSTSSSVAVKALCLSAAHENSSGSNEEAKYSSPPPLSGGVEERCKMALQHVSQGLGSLQYIDCTKPEKQKEEDKSPLFDKEEQRKRQQNTDVPKMARPFEAIPMPYSPLPSQQQTQEAVDSIPAPGSPGKRNNITFKKKKREKGCVNKAKDKINQKIEQGKAEKSPKALLCRSKAETMPTWQQPEKADNKTWKQHLKILLYEKACLVYVTHAETEYVAEFYGRSLRYISYVLYCHRILESLNKSTNAGLQSYLLGRAGDCCFMVVQDWARVDIHRHDFTESNSIDQDVLQEVFKDSSSIGIPENNPCVFGNYECFSCTTAEELMPQSIGDIEQMLVISCKCYQKALALEPHEQQKSNLQRRLGNIHNELGVLYMNQAAAQYKEKLDGPKQDEDNEYLKKLFMLSLQHLEMGIDAFEMVRDEANLALLHSNTGRLMRMCAHFHSPDSSDRRSELAGQEKHFYNKAISSYQKALMILGNRRNNPAIWDTVLWELSTTVFTMATLLQDFPALGNKSQEETEREVVEYFMKALKYCDLETPGPRFPVYQFRAATIHHRLASLYHKSFRSLTVEDPKRKNLLQLCRLHYEKASKLLSQLEHPAEYLRVQMERVALCEFQAQSATSFAVKLKSLQMALDLILQCQSILKVMLERAQALRLREDELIASKTTTHFEQSSLKKDGSDDPVMTTNNENINADHICDEIKKIKITEEENRRASECSDDKSDASKENSETTCDCSSQQDDDLAEQAEEGSLVILLEQRLQFVLRSLAKLCLTKTASCKKDKCDTLAQLYKSMYSKTLRKDEDISTTTLVSHLLEILTHLETALLSSESNATSSKTR